jgi:hypothetical protein
VARNVAEHVTWKDLDSGVVLLDLRDATYYTLNESASLIWRGLVEGRDQDSIVERLLEAYDCSQQQAQEDVSEVLLQFAKDGLLLETATGPG